MRKQTTSIRLSAADKKTLSLAARLTGRTYTEYLRDVAVLCAIRFLIESGHQDRLPPEHQTLWNRQMEECDIQDVVGLEARKGQRGHKAA